VTLAHVLEHVHDPASTLRETWNVLRAGGMLWLATPNVNAVGHRLFGRHWRGLEPPRHLTVFSARALQGLLETAGFTQVKFVATQPLARRMFAESMAIRASAARPYPVFARVAVRAVGPLADGVAGLMPQLGEELVVTATRGPSGTSCDQ
jgi:predicted SAM-dependent methyltransferase